MESSDGEDLNEVAMPGFVDILSSVITVFMFFMLITSAVMFFLSMQIKKNAIEEVKKAQEDARKKESETRSQTTEVIQKLISQLQKGEITVEQMSQKVAGMSDKGTKGGTSDSDKSGESKSNKNAGEADSVKTASPNASSSTSQNQSTTSGQITVQDNQQSMDKFSKSDENDQQTLIDQNSQDLVIIFGHGDVSVTDKTAKMIEAYVKSLKDKYGENVSIELESSNDPTSNSSSIAREAELGRTLNVRNVLLDKKVVPQSISVHDVEAVKESGTYDWVKIHVKK